MMKIAKNEQKEKKIPFRLNLSKILPVFVSVLVICIVGLMAYSNSFHVPFQWDDEDYIVYNPVITDLDYFLHPSSAEGYLQYGALVRRYVTYLSFALNYRVHGLNVYGFHILNFLIHILNALLVYAMIVHTFRTPFFSGGSADRNVRYAAIAAGLLFVSHPLQTEAVTYIYQRLASLATFFYLLSLVAYMNFRIIKRKWGRNAWYTVSLLSAVLALRTKETAVTLPFSIMFFEILFLKGSAWKRTIPLLPFFAAIAVLFSSLSNVSDVFIAETGRTVGLEGLVQRYISVEYLTKQFYVVALYLRLAALPINQNIYHDPLPSLSSLTTASSASLLILALIFVIYAIYRSRKGQRELRLAGYGIIWYFLTISVESSILKLPLLMCEYRFYLPSAGVFMVAAAGFCVVLERVRGKVGRYAVLTILFLVPSLLAVMTYQRNQVWQNKVTLWKDVVEKSPQLPLAQRNLALFYKQDGDIGKAIQHSMKALELDPAYSSARDTLALLYVQLGMNEKAIQQYRKIQQTDPSYVDAYINLGTVFHQMGMLDETIAQFEKAVQLNPNSSVAHFNLGLTYEQKGLDSKSIKHYQRAVKLKPDYAKAHLMLGLSYIERGNRRSAELEYEILRKLDFQKATILARKMKE